VISKLLRDAVSQKKKYEYVMMKQNDKCLFNKFQRSVTQIFHFILCLLLIFHLKQGLRRKKVT
jgi:hypothetical protein